MPATVFFVVCALPLSAQVTSAKTTLQGGAGRIASRSTVFAALHYSYIITQAPCRLSPALPGEVYRSTIMGRAELCFRDRVVDQDGIRADVLIFAGRVSLKGNCLAA